MKLLITLDKNNELSTDIMNILIIDLATLNMDNSVTNKSYVNESGRSFSAFFYFLLS